MTFSRQNMRTVLTKLSPQNHPKILLRVIPMRLFKHLRSRTRRGILKKADLLCLVTRAVETDSFSHCASLNLIVVQDSDCHRLLPKRNEPIGGEPGHQSAAVDDIDVSAI